MLDITKLLVGTENFGSGIRYVDSAKGCLTGVREGFGPVVAWNISRTCNLNCIHCYSSSENKKYTDELTTEEAKAFIKDLADFKVPVLLFSGGEPLMRPDFFELVEYCKECGVRVTVSTNGTLITKDVARRLKEIGVGYVGISLDGLEEVNDEFRGRKGAFQKALEGIRNCVEAGQKVGLRFTINKHNVDELPKIFDLLEKENVDRVCFYHLVYSGRGSEMVKEDITHEQSRKVLEYIIEKVLYFHEKGLKKEILTVDNHTDAVYLYRWLKENKPELADKVLSLLKINGGNRSGMAFANVDSIGNVHPDQFTQHHTLGNIRERKFSEIWKDSAIPLLAGLRDRKSKITGRCSECNYYGICNGNFRARAESVDGNFWDSDPACYLTDEEIGL
ncbi:MAG: putative heme d1 biosynthesis radical protein NirJ1 [Oscillospiraceae bacterium]|nr:putative heme d1 biosynthesis radical protein NirJ1 [Oscillospiraceae bacterium]